MTAHADVSSLPEALAHHVESVRVGLRGGAAGPERAAARESIEAIVAALIGARGRAESALARLDAVRKAVGT